MPSDRMPTCLSARGGRRHLRILRLRPRGLPSRLLRHLLLNSTSSNLHAGNEVLRIPRRLPRSRRRGSSRRPASSTPDPLLRP